MEPHLSSYLISEKSGHTVIKDIRIQAGQDMYLYQYKTYVSAMDYGSIQEIDLTIYAKKK